MGNLRALALALVLIPSVAAAQSAKDKQKASEKVKAAIAKSQAGEHEEAIELYLEAYKIIPQPLLLSNVGSEFQQMDKPVEALSYFCKYLEAEPEGSNAGYAHAQAKTLYMKVAEVPDVKDEDVCKPIVKKKEPEPPKVVEEPPKKEPAPPPPPGPKSPPLRWVGAGLGVVGAGVFGLGIYFGTKAQSISDEITNHDINDPWTGIKKLESDGESYETKQIICMVGGGIALAAGVTMFILIKPKAIEQQQQPGVTFTPVATPDSFGFAAAGRF